MPGQPLGLSNLAIMVSEDKGTLEDVYEPFLIQRGFIQRTPRGRIATPKAYAYLGIDFSKEKDLFSQIEH